MLRFFSRISFLDSGWLARIGLGAMLAALAFSASARELPDFTKLVEQNSPAVVNISTEQSASSRGRNSGNEQLDEFFRRFFPDGGGPGRTPNAPRSLGSGFIVSADGYVLTTVEA